MFMRPALLLLAGLLASGCAVTSTGDTPDADATAQSATALVVVERSTGPGDVTREAVVARFLRSRLGVLDEQALRIAGLAQDLPAPGTCTTPDEVTPSVSTRSLELLDVGPLAFEGPQSRALLLPRAMPDPAGVVSGVFYSSRSAEAFAPGARLSLRAAGGSDLEAFTVSVNAPLDFTDVRATAFGSALEVTWEAPALDARDQLYVDVLAPRLVARCTIDLAKDGGRFLVPASVLAGVAEEGQLAVHRVHREAFRAKGVEPGEVRFDVARVLPIRR